MQSRNPLNHLNQSISRLGADISRLDHGTLVRHIGVYIVKITLRLSADVDPANLEALKQWFPVFQAYFLKQVSTLSASSSLNELTGISLVGRINDFIKRLSVAHKYYCLQAERSQGSNYLLSLVKKELVSDCRDSVISAYLDLVNKLGGSGRIQLIKTKMNAASFSSGIENYNWQYGAVLMNVSLFSVPKVQPGISVSGLQSSTPPGIIKAQDPEILVRPPENSKPVEPTTEKPGPPQKKENPEDLLTPTSSKTPGDQLKDAANKEITVKNRRLWTWLAVALGAGYILKR